MIFNDSNMISISSLYKNIVSLSPYLEVLLRKIYWKNISFLKEYNPYKHHTSLGNSDIPHIDFDIVLNWLKKNGVKKGSLLVVHSSYEALECTGLEAEQIIEKLLDLVGPDGTLAMPVIRKFKGEPMLENLLNTSIEDLVCTYDVKKTKIVSGMLPYYLMMRDDSETSLCPLNPLCAVGSLAKEIVKDNIIDDIPSPHGPNSGWKFCYDHEAIIIGLGVTLEHFNTSIHVAEEAFDNWKYSKEEWFRKRKFVIIDQNNIQFEKYIFERRPEWGMLHFAEINLYNDLIRNNIVKSEILSGQIPVSFERSKELVDFLRDNNKDGYPYF